MPRDLGVCAYCLTPLTPETKTIDHVVARSWFPKAAADVPKWKVPACRRCNNDLGTMEGKVRNVLGMCLDPQDPALQEIADGARRSIDPKHATSVKDAIHRFKRKFALRAAAIELRSPNAPGILPFSRENYTKGSRLGIPVPVKQLHSVIEKWTRGVHCCEMGYPVPADHKIDTFIIEDAVALEAFSDIISHARRIQKGPGVEVLIFAAEERGERGALFAFNIWNQFRSYSSVESPGAALAESGG